MNIFIIHSLGLTERAKRYTTTLDPRDNWYLPGVHTDQSGSPQEILKANRDAMREADECHVLWDKSSLGTVFDMGMAYALDKPIKVVELKKNHWVSFMMEKEGGYLFD